MAGIQIDGVNNKIDFDDDADTSISSATDDTLVVEVGGNTLATVTATGVTINDGTTIITNDNSDTLTLQSADADASEGPVMVLDRASSSPANSDVLSAINFRGKDSGGNGVDYVKIESKINSVTDGSEFGEWHLNVMNNGTSRSYIKANDSSVIINEDSQDINFTVESNNMDPMFKVDGGMDQVCVATASDLSASLGVLAAGERAMYIAQTLNQDTSVAIWKNVYANGGNSATMIAFQNSDNTEVGSIKSSGSSTAFNTSSDYRLKENVDYEWDATTRLKQLKPARFNWIADDTNTLEDGFLAHEVSSIVPEAITGTKDAATTLTKAVIGEHGNVIAENIEEADWISGKENGTYDAETTWHETKLEPIYQQIDLGKLVPLLVKTIQELEARIVTLEGN